MKILRHSLRLGRAGWILARTGASLPPVLRQAFPFWIRLFLLIGKKRTKGDRAPLSKAFSRLGPTYIKLGQFLAVRGDILSEEVIEDLSHLHDRLPPFSQEQAEAELRRHFPEIPFAEFGEVVAAASIAQVHKARGKDGKYYAVKILRPHIEERFQQDMADLFWLAEKVENYLPSARRLRPVAVLENLQSTTLREMDLRLEAAAMSELAEYSTQLKQIHIPCPNWEYTKKNVLTVEWIEATPIREIEKLRQAGHNLTELAQNLLSVFLFHALYHGFFHADFHQGNLFVRSDGVIVPVDFGIMGRLSMSDRRAMAWILHGLLSGDYRQAARHHIDAGYVPSETDEFVFAQALRAITEPVLDRSAEEISMADLLARLFETTGDFAMETQPQLLLLQKTMLAAEGLARRLDPQVDIWKVIKPLIEGWAKAEYAAPKLIEQTLRLFGRLSVLVPEWLESYRLEKRARPVEASKEKKPKWKKYRFSFSLGLLLGILLSFLVFGLIYLLYFYPNPSFFM